MRCFAVLCYALLCIVVRCIAVRCIAVRCIVVRCIAVRCIAVLCFAVLFSLLCCASVSVRRAVAPASEVFCVDHHGAVLSWSDHSSRVGLIAACADEVTVAAVACAIVS